MIFKITTKYVLTEEIEANHEEEAIEKFEALEQSMVGHDFQLCRVDEEVEELDSSNVQNKSVVSPNSPIHELWDNKEDDCWNDAESVQIAKEEKE